MKQPTVKQTIFAPGNFENWQDYDVVRGSDRRPIAEVIELDTAKGICTRYARGGNGKLLTDGGALVPETVKGSFTLELRK